jgi:Ca2+-binding RTX toxin-like protein
MGIVPEHLQDASVDHSTPAPAVLHAGDGDQLTVPYDNLILVANYSRQGSDLVLDGPDGGETVIVGYFDLAQPPDLVTELGAVVTGDIAARLAGPLAPGQYAQASGQLAQALGAPVGEVGEVSGTVTITHADGSRVVAGAGTPVFQDDIIETGATGAASVLFIDKSTLSISDNARVVIDELVFDPVSHDGSSVLSVLQGAFVVVTGEIGKLNPDNVAIRTPVGTIGIRGSVPSGVITPDPNNPSLADGVIANLGGTIFVEAQGTVVVLQDENNAVRIGADGSITRFELDPATRAALFQNALAIQVPQPDLTTPGQSGNDSDNQREGRSGDANGGDGDTGDGSGDAGDGEGGEGGDSEGEAAEEGEATDEEATEEEAAPEAGGGGTTEGDSGTEQDTAPNGPSLTSPGGTNTGPTNTQPPPPPPPPPSSSPTGGDGTGSSGQTPPPSADTDQRTEAPPPPPPPPAPPPAPQPLILVGDAGDNVLTGGTLNDVLSGMAGNDTLVGGDGDDVLDGGAGDDVLDGGAGDDTVLGQDGNDFLVGGTGEGNDSLDGGPGTDTISYVSAMVAGVTVDLEAGFATGDINEVGNDALLGIENVIGSNLADTVFGNSANNVLFGLGGDDVIAGGDGDDILDGGTGNDSVRGDAGDDLLLYTLDGQLVPDGEGFSYVNGSVDTYDGGTGYDILSLWLTADEFALGQGEITDFQAYLAANADPNGQSDPGFQASTGLTARNFEAVEVFVDGVLQIAANFQPVATADEFFIDEDMTVEGNVFDDNGNGADSDPDGDPLVVRGINGDQTVIGTLVMLPSHALVTINADGTFVYNPNGAFDFLQVEESSTDSFNYTITDNAGGTSVATVTITIDGVNPAPQPLILVGDAGDNVLTGGTLNDVLSGMAGNDTLVGGDGDDVLDGGAGDDTVLGQSGNDFLVGGTGEGNDTLDGGPETDTVSYASAMVAGVTVDLEAGFAMGEIDEIGNDTLIDIENVIGSNLDDVISGNSLGNMLTGLGGADLISGRDGNDILDGGAGNDFLDGGSGDDSVSGGADSDTVSHIVAENVGTFDFYDGGAGNDTLAFEFTGNNFSDAARIELIDYQNHLDAGLAATPFVFATLGVSATNFEMLEVFVDGAPFGDPNSGPVAQPDAVSTNEDTILAGNVFANNGSGADSDPDGDPLTVTAVDGLPGAVNSPRLLSSGAMLTLNADGSFAYDPNGAFEHLLNQDELAAFDSFTYTVSDGFGGTDTATVTIDIFGVNDAPVVDLPSGGGGFGGNFLFVSDSGVGSAIADVLEADGHTVTRVIDDFVSLPGQFSNGVTPVLQGDLSQYDAIFWSASGNSSGDTHDASMFDGLEAYVNGGGRVFVTGYDSVASPLDPALIAFLGSTGSQDFGTPNTVVMGANSLSTGVVDIQGVLPTGFFGDTDTLFPSAGTQTVVGSASGINGASWTIRTLGMGEIAYVSNGIPGTVGSHEAWVNTSAGGAGAYNAAIRNFAFNAGTGLHVDENTALTIDSILVTDVDVGNDDLQVDLSVTHGSLAFTMTAGVEVVDGNGNDGTLSFFGSQSAVSAALSSGIVYTPNEGFRGADTLTVTASERNEGGLSTIANTSISVGDGQNAPPSATPIDAGTTDEDAAVQTIQLLSTATDPDESDVLNVANIAVTSSNAQRGAVAAFLDGEFGTGALRIDPSQFNDLAAGESETLTVSYDVIDGQGGVAPNTATLVVEGRNDAPQVTPIDAGTTNEDGPQVNIDLRSTTSDPDGDVVTVVNIQAASSSGEREIVYTVDTESGNAIVRLLPAQFDDLAAGDSETVTFSYDVIDGQGGVTPNTATLVVEGSNDAPSATPIDAGTTNENTGTQLIDLLATATDVDSADLDVANVVATSSNPERVVVFGFNQAAGPGVVSIVPNQFTSLAVGESETVTFTYDIVDGDGGTTQNTATWTVDGRNDLPNATPIDAGTTNEDAGPVVIDLLATASDPDTSDAPVLFATGIVADSSNDERTVTFEFDSEANLLAIDPSQFDDLAAGESETVTVSYFVRDNFNVIANTATLVVEGRNDAPDLSGNAALQSIAEDTANPVGASVADLFGPLFSDPDSSDMLSGVAIVANSADPQTEGEWQYSSDIGDTWEAIGNVADDGTALALSATTLIRFVPVANYNGAPPPLIVRAIDSSYPGPFSNSRVTIDTALNGGTTAISAAAVLLATTIDPVAAAPSMTVVGDASGPQDSPIPLDVTAMLTDPGEVLSIEISGVPIGDGAGLSAGTNNGGGSWTLSAGDLADLTVTPAPGNTAGFQLSVVATSTDGADTASSQPMTIDVVVVADATDGDDVITGSVANDELSGGLGDDMLFGNGGDDVLSGGEGNDQLFGGDGDDTLLGGAGSDLLSGDAGDDQLDGGVTFRTLDLDFADYRDATGMITVVLSAISTVTGDASVGTDTLAAIDLVTGSNFADSYTADGNFQNAKGREGFNAFEGIGGDDSITGNGDTFVSYSLASGGVTVDLGAGMATGDASVGTDSFTGVTGVFGSHHADTLIGSDTESESFFGLGGNDTIDGGDGDDEVLYFFAPGGVTVDLEAGTAANDGYGDVDTLTGIEGVGGSQFADVLHGDDADNEFAGLAGDDIIDGRGGFDRVDYNEFSQAGITISLSAASSVVGDESVGSDSLTSIEAISGTAFDDVFLADETFNGSFGLFNIFEGNAGNDMISGNGATQIAYRDATAGVIVDLTAGTAVGDASVGQDTIIGGVNSVAGSDFADTITGDGGANRLEGRGAGDVLTGNDGNDELFGGGGNDQLLGGGHNDTLIGGSGEDMLDGGAASTPFDFDVAAYANATGPITVVRSTVSTVTGDGSVGSDTLVSIDKVIGTDFADNFTADAGYVGEKRDNSFNDFEGRGGDDVIVGTGTLTRASYAGATSGVTVDLLAGTAIGDASVGSDVLVDVSWVFGSAFADVLRGGTPTFESFVGGAGNDVIDGRGGIDRVEYTIASAGVVVNLSLGSAADGDGGTDTLIGIENVRGSRFADVLTGDATGNILEGLDGNDILNGGAGFDIADYRNFTEAGVMVTLSANSTVTGDQYVGTDTLIDIEKVFGTDFADTFTADASFVAFNTSNSSFNEFEGGGGNDTIDGNGNTRIGFTGATAGVTVDLEAGTATGDASVGNDTILGGVVEVRGSQFGDTILGSNNEGGIERFRGEAGADIIDGRGGQDRADYTSSPTGVQVSLFDGTANDGYGFVDTLDGIEDIRGSEFDDRFVGDDSFNVLDGRGGFDSADYNYITNGLGIDVVLSAVSTVRHFLSVQEQIVNVDDTLIDIERIFGTAAADTFVADGEFSASNGSFNEFEGGAGNDTITGNGDTRAGYSRATGAVTVDLEQGFATGNASVGTDTLINVSHVRGSAFADTLSGSAAGGERFRGMAGDDVIDGRGGTEDTADYRVDPAGIFADLADGTVVDGFGDTDTLIDIERVDGSEFADTFVGSGLNDVFTGFGGNDAFDGGGGFDSALYWNATSGITAQLSAESTVTGDASVGTDILTDIERIYGSEFDDVFVVDGTFNASNGSLFEVEGQAGDDTITGNGNTRIAYSFATDGVVVDLQAGTAVGDASVGTDTILGGVIHVRGSNFDDQLSGSDAAFETFRGQGGADIIDGRGGIDRVDYRFDPAGVSVDLANETATDGFGATDTLTGIEQIYGSGFSDTLIGDAANNLIEGFDGDDTLVGGDGNDELVGGQGADQMTGGNDGDIFTWRSTSEGTFFQSDTAFVGISDRILDTSFDAGDVIRLMSNGAGTFDRLTPGGTLLESQFFFLDGTFDGRNGNGAPIVFDSTSRVYYDDTGTGYTVIAEVDPDVQLTNASFEVVS